MKCDACRIVLSQKILMMKMKKIIGIIGPKLAGKNTAAEYISDRLEIPFYTISDTLKEMAALRNLPQTRDNLIILGNELATEKGEEYLSKEILEKIRYAGIIVGMRQLGQIQYLKENSNLVLISIDASPKIRFERANEGKRTGEAENFDDFVGKEIEENSGNNIQRVFECMKLSDYDIENNSTKNNLYKPLEKVLEKEHFI